MNEEETPKPPVDVDYLEYSYWEDSLTAEEYKRFKESEDE